MAEARGVDLPEDTVEQGLQFARDLPSNAYSSLHYDLVNGKPMELEALHGTLVSIGREAGLNIPMSEAVYALLKPWELHNSR